MLELLKGIARRARWRLSGRPTPHEAFSSYEYHRHNHRTLEHLASLQLDIADSTVLEVGAGIGDHTSFFLDRGCQIVSTDARPQNVAVIRDRYPGLDVRVLDVDHPDPEMTERYDIVHCYGLLYHLKNPAEAIAFLADRCTRLLLVQTCVSFGDEAAVNPVPEKSDNPSQAVSGWGCRPTRRWVYDQLKHHFKFVYMPITQPNHEEFPIDWTAPSPENQLTRCIYVASRAPLANDLLLEGIATKQRRH